MLETINLTKVYKIGKTEVKALDDVTMQVKAGEFLSVMGPSGSGKSTLLNIIGALDRPTKGKVILDDVDLVELNDFKRSMIRREKIGFIFQTFNLIPTLTAIENVEVPLKPTGVSSAEMYERAQDLLDRVGLGGRGAHRPGELSGGERQRVAIARALINNPSVVLADEPTGEVDTKTGEKILALMRKLNRTQKCTFIIVSHDPMVAEATDRIIHLKDGKVAGEETS